MPVAEHLSKNTADESELLGGRLRLWQPLKGNRASIDGILLAAFTSVKAGDHCLDFGTGLGTVALALQARVPKLTLMAIDFDNEILEFARKNIAENGAEGSISAVHLDIRAKAADFEARGIMPSSVDAVTANPPYFCEGSVRAPLEDGRKSAFVADSMLLEDWLRAASRHLKSGGLFAMVHLPDALPEILKRSEGRFGGLEIMPVHARASEPAIRVLVRGIKGSRAPASILPSLVLHPTTGSAYTEEAEYVLRQLGALAPKS